MKQRTVLLIAAAFVIAAGPVFGRGAPAGAGGPPPGVNIGPPAGIATGRTASTPVGPPPGVGNAAGAGGAENSNVASAANVLGGLNAAHANAEAFQHANSNSMVGDLASYEQQMNTALGLTNSTDKNNAIIAARQQLASKDNKTLTAAAITRIDQLLGLPATDPTLGTSP